MEKDKFEVIKETYGIKKNQIVKIKEISSYIYNKLSSDPKLINIYVIGEIVELSKSAKGHIYFKLKEEGKLLSCTFFKYINKLEFDLENGMEVLVLGSISTYNSEYQLNIQLIFPIGEGMYAIRKKKLIAKLERKGLFKKEVKKALPKTIQNIGLITSKDSAAYNDVIKIIKTKFPFVKILVKCVLVQGKEAPEQIVNAIKLLDKKKLDVILLVRGGGGKEDLTAFDDEEVANTVFMVKTPIVTGIGHEIDTSIADMVADLSMLTPTKAAESLLPDRTQLLNELEHIRNILTKAYKLYLERTESKESLKIYKGSLIIAVILIIILVYIILKFFGVL
jgi:exodeoxyribonuclease VII large subunit